MYMCNGVCICLSLSEVLLFYFYYIHLTFPIIYMIYMACSYMHIYCMGFYGLFTNYTFYLSTPQPPTCPHDMSTHLPPPLCGPFKTSMVLLLIMISRTQKTISKQLISRDSWMLHEQYFWSMNINIPCPCTLVLFLFIWSVCLISLCRCQPFPLIPYRWLFISLSRACLFIDGTPSHSLPITCVHLFIPVSLSLCLPLLFLLL